MLRNGTKIFTRRVAGSCAVLAALAACVVATPSAQASTALAAGDLLAGDNSGNVNHYGADGTLLGSISVSNTSAETGACQDGSGRIYQTNFNDGTITRIASDGTVDASTWASGLTYPISCVVAPNGNILVGQVGGVVALDSSGSVVTTYPVGGGDGGSGAWISLDRDNCTLNVSTGAITQYNICTNSVTGFLYPNSGAFQTEQLPNGDLLVAAGTDVEEVNASGVVRTYTVPSSPGPAFLTLAIAADGNSFWVGDSAYGRITKISLSTGAVLQTWTQDTNVEGLLVYGGTARTKNLVALGDSVAAGEGINYGFVWKKNALGILKWVRTGPSNPSWTDTTSALGKNYQHCHQSSLSYPELIALEGNYNVYNMACTGATALQNDTSGLPEDGGVLDAGRFDTNGQPYPQTGYTEGGDTQDLSKTVPAQLGGSCTDCDSRNTYFNKHNPDVVLLTMGANDLNFAYWLFKCYNPLNKACNTASNTSLLNSQLINEKLDLAITLRQLNAWAAAKGKTLRVLVTNYYDPFNPNLTNCIDYNVPIGGIGITGSELAWLENGLISLNANIAADVKQAHTSDTHLTVSLVNLSNVMSGHQWCTPHPWAYGASINFPVVNGKIKPGHNQSPFHPTPEGQRAIYLAVKAHLP